jgi:hypothetical protein
MRPWVTYVQFYVRTFDVINTCWLETEILQYSYSRMFKIVFLYVTNTCSLFNEHNRDYGPYRK